MLHIQKKTYLRIFLCWWCLVHPNEIAKLKTLRLVGDDGGTEFLQYCIEDNAMMRSTHKNTTIQVKECCEKDSQEK